MIFSFISLIFYHLGAAAFSPFAPAVKRVSSTSIEMKAPPGMKPMFDGTFKKAGEEFLGPEVLSVRKDHPRFEDSASTSEWFIMITTSFNCINLNKLSNPPAGEHSDSYTLENDNGARAIVRTYGGNAFSYITKDGVEVMGKRKDAPTPIADTKPYAGGAPHCFPQFGPGALMQHGVSNKLHISSSSNL